MNNLQKRKHLIRKLFKEVTKETVGAENLRRVKLLILTRSRKRASYCEYFDDGSITIGLNLESLEDRVKFGYSQCHYTSRPDRLNKYIKKNRHNTLRFILYHEARHAWQRINNLNRDNKYQREYDADSWALAHIRTRQNKIKIGLNFKLHEKDWTLIGFREGLPLIACKQTGQEQRISDKILNRFIARA